MGEIEFESDKEFISKSFRRNGNKPVLVFLVIRIGLAKNDKQANTILLICALIFFSLSIYLLWNNNHTSDVVTLPNGTKITVQQYIAGLKSGQYK